MSSTSQAVTRTPAEVVRMAPVSQAGNGICYSVMGEITPGIADLERMVAAVPRTIAAALDRKAYYFVRSPEPGRRDHDRRSLRRAAL